jgi:hypothetical protein
MSNRRPPDELPKTVPKEAPTLNRVTAEIIHKRISEARRGITLNQLIASFQWDGMTRLEKKDLRYSIIRVVQELQRSGKVDSCLTISSDSVGNSYKVSGGASGKST